MFFGGAGMWLFMRRKAQQKLANIGAELRMLEAFGETKVSMAIAAVRKHL